MNRPPFSYLPGSGPPKFGSRTQEPDGAERNLETIQGPAKMPTNYHPDSIAKSPKYRPPSEFMDKNPYEHQQTGEYSPPVDSYGAFPDPPTWSHPIQQDTYCNLNEINNGYPRTVENIPPHNSTLGYPPIQQTMGYPRHPLTMGYPQHPSTMGYPQQPSTMGNPRQQSTVYDSNTALDPRTSNNIRMTTFRKPEVRFEPVVPSIPEADRAPMLSSNFILKSADEEYGTKPQKFDSQESLGQQTNSTKQLQTDFNSNVSSQSLNDLKSPTSGFDRPDYDLYRGLPSVSSSALDESPSIPDNGRQNLVDPYQRTLPPGNGKSEKDKKESGGCCSCCSCRRCLRNLCLIIIVMICLGGGFVAGWFGHQKFMENVAISSTASTTSSMTSTPSSMTSAQLSTAQQTTTSQLNTTSNPGPVVTTSKY